MTRLIVGAISSMLMTVGILTAQDSTARVLTSNDIEAVIGSDSDTRAVLAQVLSHLMGSERREFVLASQLRAEWLPSVAGAEFVRLADAEVSKHLAACGVYWLVGKVERVDNVVWVILNQRCGSATRSYIVSLDRHEWRLGSATGKDGAGWVPGIGSSLAAGAPPECRCR